MFASDCTKSELRIRQATRRDLESIGGLWVELMTFHANIDNRFGIPPNGRSNYIRHTYQALRDANYCVLVAEHQRRVIGYVVAYIAQNPPIFPQPYYGFIADICVTQQARRGGAGALLVHAVMAWFRERGMHSFQLNVAHHNPISQAFWRKMGCSDYIDHMWMRL